MSIGCVMAVSSSSTQTSTMRAIVCARTVKTRQTLHSPSSEKAMPERLSSELRFRALKRDEYQCQRCGCTGSESDLEVHHRTPLSEDGTNDLENLQTLCRPCHVKEHSFPDSEFGTAFQKTLREDPVVTSRDLAEKIDCSRERARQWLVSMLAEGELERKQVGGGAKVYYPPYRSDDT